MEVIIIIIRQLFIMFFYMAIGVALFRAKLVTKEGSRTLAHLLLYCILPCVIVKSFCLERTPENTAAFGASLLWAFILLLAAMLVSFVFFRRSPMDNFGAAFSNAGFMGFPLITAVLGGNAVFYAAGFVALLNALQWTYGQWILTKDRKRVSFKVITTNPIVLSLLLGVILFLAKIPVPALLTSVMGTVANMNAPVAMIVLGVYLAQTDIRKLFTTGRVYAVSAVRLLLIPAVSLLLLRLSPKLPPEISTALLIAASAPVGSNVAVYAQKLEMDYTYAVQTVCLSTLLSVVTMPAILALSQTLG